MEAKQRFFIVSYSYIMNENRGFRDIPIHSNGFPRRKKLVECISDELKILFEIEEEDVYSNIIIILNIIELPEEDYLNWIA